MSDLIRVGRNASGNCLVFYGQTNPVYFNACLTAEVVDTDYVSVRNDIASGVLGDDATYEYYRIHFSKWQRDDLSTFTSAEEAAEYINSIGNVTDVPTGGYSFQGAESLDFVRDETNTSILFSNGDHHGINAVKAVGKENGKVGIHSIYGDFEFYELEYASCTIGGASAGANLQTVVNNLNAFFTLSATTVPIPNPVYTLDGGTDISWIARQTINPAGAALYGNGTGSTKYHGPRVYTSETINEPGEYFTFEVDNTTAVAGPLFGFGLYSVDNGDLAEVVDDTLSNSGNHGYFFSTWMYNYSGYSAPWTTYGSHSGLSYGPGWSFYGNSPMFRYSDAHEAFRNGGTVLIKVGITDDGFVGVYYYDVETLHSGTYGARTNDWILLARSTTPVPTGEYGLMVKLATAAGRIMSEPKRFAQDPAAPTLYYRYIESPDGVFHYPLFATEEEANYVDGLEGGSGTSHTHTYVDDVTNTTWYMPDTGGTMSGSSAPVDTADITYTVITTLPDGSFAPSAFSGLDIAVQEGNAVNIQVTPAGANWTTTVSGLPAGLAYDGYMLIQGTAPQVSSDTTSTITVTRANAYGSSVGTFDLMITDSAPPQTNSTPWTKALDFSGSSERAQMVSSSNSYNPMMMAGASNTVSAPVAGKTVASGHPWATTCVFKIDGNSSTQHIWNVGEGANSGDDNIYLKLDAQRNLQFVWGRSGALSQCSLGGLQTNTWYGVYIGFTGERLSLANATAANMADCFDIRLMSSGDSFSALGSNLSSASNWTSAFRMDRSFTGAMTLGGRGTNRSYHGQIASFATTTLKCNDDMPDNTEIIEMITDPLGWVADYKEGNNFRKSQYTTTGLMPWDSAGPANRQMGTQIYLMGDGTNDSYSNMIRNQVNPSDQNFTKLNLLSMVSNDIQTVNILGLT